MRSATRRLLLGLHLCSVASMAAAADDVTRRLTIHWSDPEDQFPFALTDLVAETRSLFAPLGIALDWASAEMRTERDHVQVILLARDRSLGRMGERAMACVLSRAGAQPTAWILVPRVREMLGFPARRLGGEGPLLSRALARVMAHELIHLIAPEVPHAAKGLMRASLGRDFLTRRATPVLDTDLAHAIRASFAGGLWQHARASEPVRQVTADLAPSGIRVAHEAPPRCARAVRLHLLDGLRPAFVVIRALRLAAGGGAG